jgi:hypothetical protein
VLRARVRLNTGTDAVHVRLACTFLKNVNDF